MDFLHSGTIATVEIWGGGKLKFEMPIADGSGKVHDMHACSPATAGGLPSKVPIQQQETKVVLSSIPFKRY
jgi:hypothetical protein